MEDSDRLDSLQECAEHFIEQLRGSFEESPDRNLPVCPVVFVVADRGEQATVAVAYKHRGQWRMDQCSIPIENELGLVVSSPTMGDITAEDFLVNHGGFDKSFRHHSRIDPSLKLSDDWAFAVFSTGLEAALPMPSLIDPMVDEVHPSEATLDLISDPETSRFLMSRQRMKQLFPVVYSRNEKRAWWTRGMKLHRKVFICCDNDKPEEQGVLAVRMEWDGDIDKREDKLKQVGEDARLVESIVGVKDALQTARQMARSMS